MLRLRIRREESGAFLVLYGILLVALFGIASLAVDLGALREDARAGRSVADFAASAGALGIDPVFGGSPLKGCEAAWSYFLANTGARPGAGADPCPSAFGGYSQCDATMPETNAVADVGSFRVTITNPVADDSPLMEGRADSEIDGARCQRLGVTVDRTRNFVLAPIIQNVAGKSHETAVARASAHTSQGDAVSLVVLDPVGCRALYNKGQGQVIVNSAGNRPGLITMDSAGTYTGTDKDNAQTSMQCGSQSSDYVIDALNNSNTLIKAEDGVDANGNPTKGTIYDFALLPGNGNGFGFDPSDMNASPRRVYPTPTAGSRVGRAPIDWRYNCKAANGCPFSGSTSPHIDDLRTAVGTAGSAPAGFQTWSPTYPCTTSTSDPPLVVEGNWWINCPGNKGFTVKSPITFLNGSLVVENGIDLQGGSLCMNTVGTDCRPRVTPTDSCPTVNAPLDEFLYLRAGDLNRDAQSCLSLNHTFVYIDSGVINFGAGSAPLTWTAPLGGNFQNLSLWSESSAQHILAGQAALTLEGCFFTPNASPFEFQGQGFQLQTEAQFITYRMLVDGQGILRMTADPTRSVPIPLEGVKLIR